MPRLIQQDSRACKAAGHGRRGKEKGSCAGRVGKGEVQARQQSKAAGQGSRARQQGRAEEQGRKYGAGEQGRTARQQGRAAGEIQLANGRRGANIWHKKVNFFTSLSTSAKINLQTAAEGRPFVKKNINFLPSL